MLLFGHTPSCAVCYLLCVALLLLASGGSERCRPLVRPGFVGERRG
jgi:hypothetical protein